MKKKTPQTKTTKPKARVPRQEKVRAGLYFTGAGIAQLSAQVAGGGTIWTGYLWRAGTNGNTIPGPVYCHWSTDDKDIPLAVCTYAASNFINNDFDLLERCPSDNLGALFLGFNPRNYTRAQKPKPEPKWLPWTKSDEIPFYMVEYRQILENRNIHKPTGLSVDDDSNPLLLQLDSTWYTTKDLLELWEYRQFDSSTGYSDWEKCGNLQTTKPLF
jgi:hypothetical protein